MITVKLIDGSCRNYKGAEGVDIRSGILTLYRFTRKERPVQSYWFFGLYKKSSTVTEESRYLIAVFADRQWAAYWDTESVDGGNVS